ALKCRSVRADDAIADALGALAWLRANGAEQIIYKVCSTFDSTDSGNIGPVTEALADALDERFVIVCPAFPTAGRTVYQGHLFVHDALLSESGMESHPLNPMRDPDLRRVLARQTARAVGHLPLAQLRVLDAADAGSILERCAPDCAARTFIITDAIDDTDLHRIGLLATNRALLVGGSGIALGLPANFGHRPGSADWTPVTGPGAVLSGSCSRQTLRQVTQYAATAPAWRVTPQEIISATVSPRQVADWVLAQVDHPLVYTTVAAEHVLAVQSAIGADAAAHATEEFFANLAALIVDDGIRRLVIAGGETSSAVVSRLAPRSLTVGPAAAPGVPLMFEPDRCLALALKSGNFGTDDFFSTCLSQMVGENNERD
ncbi:MAG: 3-oxo-tetronate kinase, partial [Pseudomonadota bacterium]